MIGILLQESLEVTIVLCKIMYRSVHALYRTVVPAKTVKHKMIELSEYEGILKRLENLEGTKPVTLAVDDRESVH